MFYYKSDDGILIQSDSLYTSDYTLISEEEYNKLMEQNKPTGEDIRAEKEEELMRLMQELHPEFAVQMLGALEQEEEQP